MKKIIYLIFLLLIIVGCSNEEVVFNDNTIKDESPTISNPKLKAIDCLPEQRDVDGCIEIYQPVCGYVQVECIKAPCNPVKETFENSCKACANSRVISYTQGECLKDNEIKI
jgi:hypothetical protein|tara:strand:+ start:113 stop:448 length:336 start_codon:yes stop_codon:yes gene_type:complete